MSAEVIGSANDETSAPFAYAMSSHKASAGQINVQMRVNQARLSCGGDGKGDDHAHGWRVPEGTMLHVLKFPIMETPLPADSSSGSDNPPS